jgi:hypothetical protein
MFTDRLCLAAASGGLSGSPKPWKAKQARVGAMAVIGHCLNCGAWAAQARSKIVERLKRHIKRKSLTLKIVITSHNLVCKKKVQNANREIRDPQSRRM